MNSKYFILVLSALFIFAAACKKDKPPQRTDDPVSPVTGNDELKGVFITNEGNFQFGNAAVSFLNGADNSVTEDLYKMQNNVSIGDIAQSINKINGLYYIVINNSSKIEIVNPVTFKSEGKIAGLTSPRYIESAGNNKAYVSDLYANAINIVDLGSRQKTGAVPCNGWTEEMVKLGSKLYVTNMKTEYLYIVNTLNDVIEDSIHVVYASGSIAADANGKLWVLSTGNTTTNILPALQKIDPLTKQVELSLSFTAADAPRKIRLNAARNRLYILNNGVQQMNISDNSLPVVKLITQGNRLFYGIGIDPANENIFVSDAVDYVQRGWVLKYSNTGQKTDSFKVGIIPGEFYFNP